MATKQQQSSTPKFFNFLKEGLLLPTKNPRLFAVLFSIIVVSTSALLLGNFLAVEHLTDDIRHDIKALNSTNPRTQTQEYLHLLQEIQHDARELLLVGAAYLLLSVVVGSAIGIVILFAAVRTYSGETHTFGSLLSEVRSDVKGPLLTLAFVFVLQTAYMALVLLLGVMAGLSYHLTFKQHMAVFVVLSLLLIIAFLFLVYFSILCSLALVVAVAEPGCHGASAVGRARRLVKGKFRRAILFVAVTCVLTFAIIPIHSHARRSVESNMVSGWLIGFVYTVLAAAVRLFADCAMTAFYYECKASTEASATEYAMVATKEQFDA